MIPFNKAKNIVQSHLFQLGNESVALNDSSGRILTEDMAASMPSPRFDNSAMDGFAVCAADTIGASQENPIELKMVSISSAGSPSDVMIGPGECAQCMTGAAIPKGADAIVMVEDTSGFTDNKIVQIMIETTPGKHIRMEGEEIKKGDMLAIFGTGNELVEPGNTLEPGQIYNSNLYVFADLAQKAGAEVVMRDVIQDDKASLRHFLSDALDSCDVVISSGGVSMGRYDYVRDVFMELGVKEHFWKVAQKPGKPLFFGTGQDTLIFGLPGNPVSSYIGFMEWVWPALETIMGKNESEPLTGKLTESFPREPVKKRFLFGKVWIENGQLVCRPASKVGSHMLTSSLDANCILSADPEDSILNNGDKITINILPWKTVH